MTIIALTPSRGAIIRRRQKAPAVPDLDAPLLRGLGDSDTDQAAVSAFHSVRLRWAESVMFDERLTLLAKVFAHYISSRLNKTTGLAFFSMKRAGADLSSSERSIRRACDDLIETGWILGVQPNRRMAKRYLCLLKNIPDIDERREEIRLAFERMKSESGQN